MVSLRIAGNSNESSELVLRSTDGPSTPSGNNVVDRLTSILGSSGSAGHLPNHQAAVQFRPSLPGFPYPQSSSSQQVSPNTAMVVRNPSPSGTLVHHRPVHNAVAAAPVPPPYAINSPTEHHTNSAQQSFMIPAKEVVSGAQVQQQTAYRLAPVSGGSIHQHQAHVVASPAPGTRQVVVRPPHQQPSQMVQQQQKLQVSPCVTAASSQPTVNNAKNSPLLVGLLQQPDQSNKSAPIAVAPTANASEMGLASSHLTNMAANHYSNNNATNMSHFHHRQMNNPSSVNQYSSTTRCKDGLTTHQQVYSGGSVITNARVPVLGGLHPPATGKPPPVVSSSTQNVLQQQPHQQQQSTLARHLSTPQHILSTTPSTMQQAAVLPQRAVLTNCNNGANGSSPSPAISPTPSLPSPHPTLLPPSSSSVTQPSASGIPVFSSSNNVTALTPPLTPSNNNNHHQSTVANVSSSSVNPCSSSDISLKADLHSVAASNASQSSIFQCSTDSKVAKAPSPKFSSGTRENQYLINPNTGLLEPRPTDSSDSESDLPPCSPVQKCSQTPSQSKSLVDLLMYKQSDLGTKTSHQQDSQVSATREDSKDNENPKSHESTASSVSSLSANKSDVTLQSAMESSPVSDSNKQKEELSTWEKIVKPGGPGPLKVKLKLPKEQKAFSSNALKKNDRKDTSPMSVSMSPSSQSSSEQRVPKLHIKFDSNAAVIVKSIADDKDNNRKACDKPREDRKRKSARKRSKNNDCESDRLDMFKSKVGRDVQSMPSVLKLGDLKKSRLDLDGDESCGYRGKDSGDSRVKGPRTSTDDKYPNKVDSVKIAKYEAKLRTRPKMKQSLHNFGDINNIGEITSHKILDTLPPSITRVAALHTQQPHRNPTPSSSSSYFNDDSGSSSRQQEDCDLYSDLKEESPPIRSGSLMNGDLSHRSSEGSSGSSLARSLHNKTFSELTAAGNNNLSSSPGSGKLVTSKRKNTSSPHQPMRSMILKKEAASADDRRRTGKLISF